MSTPMHAVRLKIEGDLVRALEDARDQLARADRELVLDFSSVQRMAPSVVGAMDTLAGAAAEKGVRIELEGVSVEVYRVLKLVKLAPRFSFTN